MKQIEANAILLATVILTPRKLEPLLEQDDHAGKPNMGTEFWVKVYTKRAIERYYEPLVQEAR
jgi:hypothetical protein